ncbi:MAG: 2-dehydro-3-deoxygalactonokinase [Rhodanobacter sp.]|jgi:2-dehydro-3-deoxygalactonokinase
MRGLIGLDWGTSSLRAYLFDGNGAIAETRARPWGIRQLPAGGFAAALLSITQGWPALPRMACGMVGSRNGWREIPYLDLPAGAEQLASSIAAAPTDDGTALWIVPGLYNPSGPDVMRGEETQLIGALHMQPALAAQSTWLLPGTHSKWATVRDGQTVDFCTRMTGELYAVLCHHSILGSGVPEPEARSPAMDRDAFHRGVMAARDSGSSGAVSVLFSARTLMLSGVLEPASVPDYLSGLLIGEELRSLAASRRFALDATIQLIGEAPLCARYRDAGDYFDIQFAEPWVDAAAHGLWRLSQLTDISASAVSATAEEF